MYQPPPRESIFFAALRTFCRILFGVLAVFIALMIGGGIYATFFDSPVIDQKTTLTILPDADGHREMVSSSAPVILEIPIHGVIGDPQKLNAEIISHILLDSRSGFLADNRVKGVLLHFDTPGGTVVDSESIYQMLNDYKKRHKVPIFGFVEGLCASGGMYVASAADRMYAGPASIIGSVGVIIGPFFNVYELIDKWGIDALTITAGLDKDMLNPTRPWKEGEDRPIKAITEFMYQRFVDIVTRARPQLDRTKLVYEYGAKVFDCITAHNLGYIDYAMSSRDQALKALLEEANINGEQPYQVVTLSPKNQWISDIISGKSPLLTGKIEHTFGGIPREVREQPCYLYRHD